MLQRLHARTIPNDGQGPPMLLVHGMLSSSAQWDCNAKALGQGAQPVAVDLWGHGESPVPSDAQRYTARGYVQEFERLRAELGHPRLLLCGQSLGGALVLHYALQHPEAVLGVVFTNSMSAFAPPRPAAESDALLLALERDGRAAVESLPFHPRRATRLAPEVRERLIEAAAQVDPRAVARTIRHTSPTLYLGDALASLRVPALLVNGSWETSFQPLRRDLATRAPQIQVVDLACGHAVTMEADRDFDAAVLAFLHSLPAG